MKYMRNLNPLSKTGNLTTFRNLLFLTMLLLTSAEQRYRNISLETASLIPSMLLRRVRNRHITKGCWHQTISVSASFVVRDVIQCFFGSKHDEYDFSNFLDRSVNPLNKKAVYRRAHPCVLFWTNYDFVQSFKISILFPIYCVVQELTMFWAIPTIHEISADVVSPPYPLNYAKRPDT